MVRPNFALRLAKGFRIQYEDSVRNHVLLYPEGVVDLSESAAKILMALRTPKTVDSLESELRSDYGIDTGEELEGLRGFLGMAQRKRWLVAIEDARSLPQA